MEKILWFKFREYFNQSQPKLTFSMKKLFLFAAIFISGLYSSGQAKIAIGIKGGLNFSDLDISNMSTSGKTGYHAGVFAQFRFKKTAFQPEIIFSQQGSVVNPGDWDSKYLNIPLILKYFILAGVNLQLGPQFGFLSTAELDGQDIKNLLKTADISFAIGAGWDAPFRITFDARYNIGLTDNNESYSSSTIKNQVFQISAGIKLVKSGK